VSIKIYQRSDCDGALGVEDEGAFEAEVDAALSVLVVVAGRRAAEVADGDGRVADRTAVLELVALSRAAVLALLPRNQVHQQALETVSVSLLLLAGAVEALKADEVEGVLAPSAIAAGEFVGRFDAGGSLEEVRAALADESVVLEADDGLDHQALGSLLLVPLAFPTARGHRGHLQEMRGRQLNAVF
jgi:hypothetical protein